jgi:hypothetical protein
VTPRSGLLVHRLRGSGALGAETYGAIVGTDAGLPIVVIYAAVNVALMIDWVRRGRRETRSSHLVIPLLGTALWALPIYYAVKPGQPDTARPQSNQET